MFHGKIHCKWQFSIAMLNYQRVPDCNHPEVDRIRMNMGFFIPAFHFQEEVLDSISIVYLYTHMSYSQNLVQWRRLHFWKLNWGLENDNALLKNDNID